MALSTHTTPTGLSYDHAWANLYTVGFLRLSIHSAPPFFRSVSSVDLICASQWLAEIIPISSQQPNASTQSIIAEQWIRLILSYAQHQRLFILCIEDAETTGVDWDEVLWNERINSAAITLGLNICWNFYRENLTLPSIIYVVGYGV
jgi:ESCRT-II complex subunit VPS25